MHFDSAYRDRNQWPLQAEFEIPISQTGRAAFGRDALDPIADSMPAAQWTGQYLAAPGALTYPPLIHATTLEETSCDVPPQLSIPAMDPPSFPIITERFTNDRRCEWMGMVLAGMPQSQPAAGILNGPMVQYSSSAQSFALGTPVSSSHANAQYPNGNYYRGMMIAVYGIKDGTNTVNPVTDADRPLLGAGRISQIQRLAAQPALNDFNMFSNNVLAGEAIVKDEVLDLYAVSVDNPIPGFWDYHFKCFRIYDPTTLSSTTTDADFINIFVPGTRLGQNAYAGNYLENCTIGQSHNPSIGLTPAGVPICNPSLAYATITDYDGTRALVKIAGDENQFATWEPWHTYAIRYKKQWTNRNIDCAPYNYDYWRFPSLRAGLSDESKIVFTNAPTYTIVTVTNVAPGGAAPTVIPPGTEPAQCLVQLPDAGDAPFVGCPAMVEGTGPVALFEIVSPDPPITTGMSVVATDQEQQIDVVPTPITPTDGTGLEISVLGKLGAGGAPGYPWLVAVVAPRNPGTGYKVGDEFTFVFMGTTFTIKVTGIEYPIQCYTDYTGWFLRFLPQMSEARINTPPGSTVPPRCGEPTGAPAGFNVSNLYYKAGTPGATTWIPYGTYPYFWDSVGQHVYTTRKIVRYTYQPLSFKPPIYRATMMLDSSLCISGVPTPTNFVATYPPTILPVGTLPNQTNAGRIQQAIQILEFSHDSFNPFTYTGSLVSQQEMVCYRIDLLNVILPNVTLATGVGNRIAFYPYVFVEFNNVSSAGAGRKNIIYSNNPNATKALFIAAVDDVANPVITAFVKIDGDGASQTVKFKPNDNMYFAVRLPNGELFETLEKDHLAPLHPNPALQVSVCFGVKRL